jgi:hypothetical protein
VTVTAGAEGLFISSAPAFATLPAVAILGERLGESPRWPSVGGGLVAGGRVTLTRPAGTGRISLLFPGGVHFLDPAPGSDLSLLWTSGDSRRP